MKGRDGGGGEQKRERERERKRGGLGVGVATGRRGGVWEKLLPRKKKRRRARRVPRGPHWATKNNPPPNIFATPRPRPPPPKPSVFNFLIFNFFNVVMLLKWWSIYNFISPYLAIFKI